MKDDFICSMASTFLLEECLCQTDQGKIAWLPRWHVKLIASFEQECCQAIGW